MQRLCDFTIAIISLVILSPMLLLLAIVLRFTGEGEVFFIQERLGQNEIKFKLLKFATMLKDSANMGTQTITVQNDPRILPVGRFLRRTKINELPQLWNVLLGEMSLIGPRPLTSQTFSMYSEDGRAIIGSVKPGLSGVGSVIFRAEEEILQGPQNGTETYRSFIAPYKEKLEIWYCANNSFFLYLRLIFLTVWVVFFPSKAKIELFLPNIPEMPEQLREMLSGDQHPS